MIISTADIISAVRACGCRIAVQDGQLLVSRQRLLPPDLLTAIRAHRQAIMCLVEAEAAHLPPDCAPWLHIARQILAGEFDGGDRSLLDSLLIGVRNIAHPLCQQARARLEKRKEARR